MNPDTPERRFGGVLATGAAGHAQLDLLSSGAPRLAVRAAVFAVGHAGRNRASGAVVVAALALLVATGYAFWYFATDETRPTLSIAHWASGLALVALLPVHVVRGRRSRGAGTTPGPASPSRRAS